MMYESLFEELSDILKRPTDTAQKKGLEDFFRGGPGQFSPDWAYGTERQFAAHLFASYLMPESAIWNESYLDSLSPLLPEILIGQLEQKDIYGESSFNIAYRKKIDHPLIVMHFQRILKKADFDPEAAPDLIINDTKRKMLTATLDSERHLLTRPAEHLLEFCKKITAYKKISPLLVFFQTIPTASTASQSLNGMTLAA
ncbi:MAG: hypothetical protein NTV32_04065 [Gammaproteobacteria bacterium]|nr:hypothetical protein [Gammaproteobacteria bacterium]